ncbi:MAG: thymidine phosphorylase [Acidobacteria bacterium]|nr:thymidine phosphorylase [Acidobacteriota bacterium]
MRTVDLIRKKRNGEELTDKEIEFLVENYTRGAIPDYQMAAFLMAVYYSNLSENEVTALTLAMLNSGRRVDLSDLDGAKVDKHSTGGVGDKTSLIAAPIAAAAGVVVPMISGRGLGHTGGTVDKLESIPGFRTRLSVEEFRANLNAHRLCFMGQTDEIVPADQKLYALRDVTASVESLPLIAASIMSKKLAEGMDGLVLDVKVGSGAFLKRQLEARKLAQLMVTIGRRMNKRVHALLTDMDQPLGYAVGNALEIMEVSQTLQSQGPADLTQLSIELAARMINLANPGPGLEAAREQASALLASGAAFTKLQEVIAAQGGNPDVLNQFELLPNASGAREILSPRSGYVTRINAEDIGQAAVLLGAGRDTIDRPIDPAVGVILERKVGEKVAAGGRLCTLYHTDDARLEEAAQLVEDAFHISAAAPEQRQLVLEVIQ